MSHLVIIGGGLAAISAAQAACNADAALQITILAAEPYLPYQRPMLSKGLATGVDVNKIALKSAAWFDEQRIEMHTSKRVTALETNTRIAICEDGTRIQWDALVLATGASAFSPPIDGVNALTLRTYDDMQRLRTALASADMMTVVGGGILGMEIAWEARKAIHVQILETSPYLLRRQLSEQAAQRVLQYLTANGIEVVTSVDQTQIGALCKGVVCVAAGARADTGLAAGAGLQVGRGIAVNEMMETSVKGIFAAGDVAELPGGFTGLLAIANGQGAIAGANAVAFLNNTPMRSYVITPPPAMLKIGDMSLLSVGDISAGEPLVYQDDARYVELRVLDGKLVAGILMGDVAVGMKLSGAIAKHMDVGTQDALAVLATL